MSGGGDLSAWLEGQCYPALLGRLDTAFPEYGFKRAGTNWIATKDATRGLPGQPRPDRVYCYANRPWGLVIQGGDFVRFLDLVNGLQKPTGPEFIAAARALAGRAGIAPPGRELSPEEADREAKAHERRSALDVAVDICRRALKTAPATVREYVQSRGYDSADIDELGLGYLPSVKAVRAALETAGASAAMFTSEGANGERRDDLKLLEGRVIYPWRDASGQLLTLYGDWPARPTPEKVVKLSALRGEGTKASPLHFDRARQAGHRELVLVEGVADASVLQVKGDSRVVACVGRQLSGAQLETLARYNVTSVTICLDPDGAGEEGTLACIRQLTSKGIAAYVAPRLPDGMDPDTFVLERGIEAWRKHIDAAEHAFRYQAKSIVGKHKGDAWTDRSKASCLDDAVEFDEKITDPTRATDLSEYFWPEICSGTGADMEAVMARVGHHRERLAKERERSDYERLLQQAGAHLNDGNIDALKEHLQERVARLASEERHRTFEPVRSVADELAEHAHRIGKYRGRDYIGLPQKTLKKLDDMTLGLRGLMLLAAAPNVGKTTLGVQLGLDVVTNNDDAAFLFLSLEMSRWDMLTRMTSYLARMDWKTVVFGSNGGTFSQDEHKRLTDAEATLARLGPRIRILDDTNFPLPTLARVIDQARDLKATTGAKRLFVLADYLQVWPVPEAAAKALRTDLDADKWRIGQMKELRDAIDGDPVLVISEARKPDKDKAWAGALTDVMGSARGTYTPDIVMLQHALTAADLKDAKSAKDESDGEKLIEKYAGKGYARQRLTIAKGRDGVQRGGIDVRFNFRQSTFAEWTERDN